MLIAYRQVNKFQFAVMKNSENKLPVDDIIMVFILYQTHIYFVAANKVMIVTVKFSK